MVRLFQIIAICVLTLAASQQASARILQHGTCVVDNEIFILPPCAVESKDGHIYIASPYLPLFNFAGSQHLAYSYVDGKGWIYFNHRGLVVVEHVATMDNGPNEFHHGLVRVTANDKWGLANLQGTFIVPLQYDGMLDYNPNDGWQACTGCHTAGDGEHHWFEGGTWISLNRRGHVTPTRPQTKHLELN